MVRITENITYYKLMSTIQNESYFFLEVRKYLQRSDRKQPKENSIADVMESFP